MLAENVGGDEPVTCFGLQLMEGKLRSTDGKELFSPFGDEGAGIQRLVMCQKHTDSKCWSRSTSDIVIPEPARSSPVSTRVLPAGSLLGAWALLSLLSGSHRVRVCVAGVESALGPALKLAREVDHTAPGPEGSFHWDRGWS